ncbi:hypothetical protein LRP88_04346 [Fusarium phalaenopsidis]
MQDIKGDPEKLAREASILSEVGNIITEDPVFGTITKDGPNYRDVGWVKTTALMMKAQIGLGVLSLPSAFNTLGIIPGIICLLAIGIIITWSMDIIGVFKLNHPEVYGIDEAMFLIFGRVGRELVSIAFVLYLIFATGSGMLGISIGLNAVSTHAICTSAFVAIAAVATICFASIRTLSRISWLGVVGLICLLIAVFMVTIAVGVQDRPDAAPTEGPWKSDYKLVGNPSFTEGMSAIGAFIFAYSGPPSFFALVGEMRDPRQYRRAMVTCQTVVTITYIIVAIVVYYYCGSYVASPALGSAGKTIKRIAYGIAIPGLLASTSIGTHIVSKWFFVRILRDTKHLSSNTLVHWGTWLGLIVAISITSYVIAAAVPVFNGLVSVIGSFLSTLLSFQPFACMWLYDNWAKGKEQRQVRWMLMVIWAGFVLVAGTFMMVSGTYGSIVSIIASLNADGASRPFSCADNSNSV